MRHAANLAIIALLMASACAFEEEERALETDEPKESFPEDQDPLANDGLEYVPVDSEGSREAALADDTQPQPLGSQICETVQEQLIACGRVVNTSGTPIVAYMDRCGSGATPCEDSHQRRLLRGQGTPGREDWDLVWVPCRSFGFKNIAGGANIPWTGGGGFHIVRDPETLTIVSTTC